MEKEYISSLTLFVAGLKVYTKSELVGAEPVIVCNPPYGERLELDDAAAFYRRLGDCLKKKNWTKIQVKLQIPSAYF